MRGSHDSGDGHRLANAAAAGAVSRAAAGTDRTPCADAAADPELWFAERPADLHRAKALCAQCPIKAACLAAALERREPWGVWGGEILQQGIVLAYKRGRGRPSNADRRLGLVTRVADRPAPMVVDRLDRVRPVPSGPTRKPAVPSRPSAKPAVVDRSMSVPATPDQSTPKPTVAA